MQEEWERIQNEKKPDLLVVREADALEESENLRIMQKQRHLPIINDKFDLPWNEEHNFN